MVARVWFSRSILTPSLASTAWCVDDDYLAVFDHVFAIVQVEDVRAQALLHVMVHLDESRVVEVLDAEEPFDLGHALLGQPHAAMFFVDGVIAGGPLLAGLFALVDLAFLQLGDDAVDLVILIGGFLARAGDD